jgi:phosphate transport system ATP-binding protein
MSVTGDGTLTETTTATQAEVASPRLRLTDPKSEVAIAGPSAETIAARGTETEREVVFRAREVSVNYGEKRAIEHVSMDIHRNYATALIGPSGCGKSTFLRCMNRMNDSIVGFRLGGELLYHGHDLYDLRANRVEVRRRIGMVFQKPNPFPKSIYDNIAWAARNLGMRDNLDERVERALRGAALWEEVKDRLKSSALGLSGGQQQRLCIARAIAIEPDVLLLDEPASALDPIATASIEELIHELKLRYTIVIVTHNMQQAMRVADKTAFFSLDETRIGTLIEYDDTDKLFSRPTDGRTRDYITGQFG